jgi:acetolactate synthase I/II/III large subunit
MENDSKKTAAELLAECLEEEGVDVIFGIPGEENLAMIEALSNHPNIRFITTRHEQGAAFMADVYGRLSGKAGVCLATLGPGATNLVTGVADADSDGAPLVAITGQVGTERMHLTSHQFLNLTKMFEPITKRTKMVVNPETTNEIVRLAFKYAESEKPGATHIDLPVNVGKMTVNSAIRPIHKKIAPKEFADLESIEAAAGLLFQAKNPVMLTGAGAIRSRAAEAVTRFANKLKIPVVNTMMSKGIIPFDNPYSMWTVGIPQSDYQNKILADADLVLAVGYDLVEYAPQKWNPHMDKTIIHIDLRPAHINQCYQAEVEVIGDISNSLDRIATRCSRNTEPERALAIRDMMVKEYAQYEDDLSFPPKPQKILHDVRSVLGPEDILISDVGAHKMWIARHYNCYRPGTCIISNGFASMGIAVPGAVAAKLLNPDKKILAITGDGGFMMNNQELETAFREQLPIVVLIFHDDSYGLIKWKQMDQYGHSGCVDFSNPDFVKFAESMHGIGYRIEKTEDIVPVLKEAFQQTVPVIIDCPVDYRENTKLTEHLKKLSKTLKTY